MKKMNNQDIWGTGLSDDCSWGQQRFAFNNNLIVSDFKKATLKVPLNIL